MKKWAIQRKMELVGVSSDSLIEQRNKSAIHVFKSALLHNQWCNYQLGPE